VSVSYEVKKKDADIIQAIAERANREMPSACDVLNTSMDITACHANGCPLRLKDLLAADDFNFFHDVLGVKNHLNRKTGKLDGRFMPRYSA